MPTVHDIITEVIRMEKGYVNHPADRGGRTDDGISERSHPEAWADGTVTEAEKRQIYLEKYVKGPGLDQIPDPHLMAQMVDFAVHSGPAVAIMKLQAVLGVKVDGILGPKTLGVLSALDPTKVGNFLVGERVKMLGRIVSKNKSQLVFLSGWLTRAVEFLH